MKRGARGFTLIELLIVVVLIGILCAITIPRWVTAKQSTYVVTMKSDLRNMATFQESYAADSLGNYFSGDGSAQGYRPSMSVSVNATAIPGPPSSWSAEATHSLTTKTCAADGFGIATCS